MRNLTTRTNRTLLTLCLVVGSVLTMRGTAEYYVARTGDAAAFNEKRLGAVRP